MFALILLLVTICIIFGAVSIVSPATTWEMQERMRYKDSDREPSGASLFFIRLEGVAIIALAIICLVQTWGSLSV